MKGDFSWRVLRARMSCEASAVAQSQAWDARRRAAATRDHARFLRDQAAEIRAERKRLTGPGGHVES